MNAASPVHGEEPNVNLGHGTIAVRSANIVPLRAA